MRLSTIKLAGFKSFVEPTKIPFPDQMTCVVGPNGCGKSNVIDAVRWVLGESSAKNLRGDAMTDVIFNGSTTRKPISQASVELIFDNTTGHLPNTFADRNQVAIKRLVTRDGQSFYFLNGSKCRKRDITDIFLGTGLGPRSYAIIEQGMISRLIESKPQELRVFLEEAAGVSKYKERRRETQTRIKSTRENLERLLDVRKELQSQLDKLAIQSVDAKKYREFKAQERILKGQIAVLKWQKLHQQQLDKSEKIAKLNEEISFFEIAHLGHDDVLASLESQVQSQQDKLTDAQHQQHLAHTELTRAEQQQISLKQQQQALKQNLIKLEQRQIQITEQKLHQQRVCEEREQALQITIENSVTSTEQVNELSETLAQHAEIKQAHSQHYQTLNDQQLVLQRQVQSAQNTTTHTEQSIGHLNEQLTQVESQLNELKGRNVAQQLEQQKHYKQTLTQELAVKQTAYSQSQTTLVEYSDLVNKSQHATEQLAQQCNELRARIAGLKSSLGLDNNNKPNVGLFEQLSVRVDFEHIIEHALSSLAHLRLSDEPAPNSVWKNETNTPNTLPDDSLAHYIDSGVFPELLCHIAYAENGELTALNNAYFIAVIDKNAQLKGRNWRMKSDKSVDDSLLLKHTHLHEKSQQLVILEQQHMQEDKALASHLQVHSLESAKQSELKDAIHQLAQNIAITNTRSDMLAEQASQHQRQVSKLTEKNEQIITQRMQLTQQLNEQQHAYSELLEQHRHLRDEVQAAHVLHAQSSDHFNQINSQLAHYKTLAHQASLDEQKGRSEWQLSQTKLEHTCGEYNGLRESLQELNAEYEELLIPEQQLVEKISALLTQDKKMAQQRTSLQGELSKAKTLLSEKQASLKQSQSGLVALQTQLQKLTLDEQSLSIKAQVALEPLQELKQTLQQVLETMAESMGLIALQNTLAGLSNQLERLGAVNLAAIDEFEHANIRSEYLDSQLEDLTKALNTLEGAISKIDKETKTRFKATFDQVNNDFSTLFPKVFGGGSAYLELTSDDLLESGVSIMARPPGKKNSTIHLLSGGEKALSALSLVFSIFRLNPAPFCMLDEVDAPLDDANVVRFCRLVEEMSQSVQFIYISHNKIAMEMAGRLTGVTMAEPGVSRMVAVDIEQAVQLAHT
jgi:chromosome segregation protein